MRRLTRHLFTFVSAVSLLLCVAVCVLWVRSVRNQGWVCFKTYGPANCYAFTLGNYPGRLAFAIAWQRADAPPVKAGNWTLPPLSARERWTSWSGVVPAGYDGYTDAARQPGRHHWAGVVWWTGRSLSGGNADLLLPHRYVVTVLALLTAACAWPAVKRRRRAKRHLCLRCGYDLRASPERCPECGTVSTAT